MKKITVIFLLGAAMILSACGGNQSTSDSTPSSSGESTSSQLSTSEEPVARRVTQEDIDNFTKAYDEGSSYTLVMESSVNINGAETFNTMTLKRDGRKAHFEAVQTGAGQAMAFGYYYELNEEGTSYDLYSKNGDSYIKETREGTRGYPDILYGLEANGFATYTLGGMIPVTLLTSEIFEKNGNEIRSLASVYVITRTGTITTYPQWISEAPSEQVSYMEYKDHLFTVDSEGTLLSGSAKANIYSEPGSLTGEGNVSFSFKDVLTTSVTLPTI